MGRELKDYKVKIEAQKMEKTHLGDTRPDRRIVKEQNNDRIASIESKDGDARRRRKQRERQDALGDVYVARNYRDRGEIKVDGKPGPEWMEWFKRWLDRLGLRRE